MSTSQTIEYSLVVNADVSYSDIRKLETAIVRTLNLAQRLTGNENLQEGLQTIQKAIMMLRTLQMAYQAVQIARMAAGDPIAWFSAAATVGATALTIYDSITGV